MMKRRLKICRTCGKIFIDTGILNKHNILHDDEKAQNLQDMWGIIPGDTGTLNKHKILHDEENAQNFKDMWEIIHGDWDPEQTHGFT